VYAARAGVQLPLAVALAGPLPTHARPSCVAALMPWALLLARLVRRVEPVRGRAGALARGPTRLGGAWGQ
jgi:hypothetical protein